MLSHEIPTPKNPHRTIPANAASLRLQSRILQRRSRLPTLGTLHRRPPDSKTKNNPANPQLPKTSTQTPTGNESRLFTAFQDTIEFCDWPEYAVHKRAADCIDGYFAGRTNPASKLLLDSNGTVNALALFITTKSDKTKLDLLFVLPQLQRQGIATEMVSLACNELQQQGISEIDSSLHALNIASENWHHSFGFTDVYDQYFIQRKYNWYKREIHRLESQGVTDGIKELSTQKDHWHSLMNAEWQSYTKN